MLTRNDDLNDPIARSYRHIYRKLRTLVVLAMAITFMLVFFGVPSVQYTYKAYPTRGVPTASQKTEADYWNPISGWRNIRAGELVPGCPFVIFLPLQECVDLKPFKIAAGICAVLTIAACLMILFCGVPSIQFAYKAFATSRGCSIDTEDSDADYWNPISGWINIDADELPNGFRAIVFLPLRRCMNLKPYENVFTSYLFGKEFFDGP